MVKELDLAKRNADTLKTSLSEVKEAVEQKNAVIQVSEAPLTLTLFRLYKMRK